MKTAEDFLVSFVKRADYFGESVKLHFDNNKKFKTILGGILSISILVLIIALLVSLGQNLVNRDIPRTNSVTLFKEYPPPINLKKNYLNFAFGFELFNGLGRFYDPTYFSFEVVLTQYNRTNSSQIRTNNVLNFSLCKDIPETFVNDRFNYSDKVRINQVDKLFCLQNNDQTLEGAYTMQYFANIRILATKCKNSTTSKIICKPPDEINKILLFGTFQVIYTDRYMDVIDFKNPMKEFFSQYYVKIDPNMARFINIFFKKIEITTDVGYVFSEYQTESHSVFDYYRDQFDSGEADTKIVTFFINSSFNLEQVSRNYLKFTEMLATIGGITNVCLVVGQIIARFFGDTEMKIKLMDTLFYFDLQKEEDEAAKHIQYPMNSSNLNLKLSDSKLNQENDRLTYLSSIKSMVKNSKTIPNAISLNVSNIKNESSISAQIIEVINLKKHKPNNEELEQSKEKKKYQKPADGSASEATEKSEFGMVNLDKNEPRFIKAKEENYNPNETVKADITEKDIIFETIDNFRRVEKGNIKSGFMDIFGIKLCCCCKKYRQTSKAFDIGVIQLNKYFDCLKFVRILQEFDKMKSVLFDKNRQDLFKFTNKPTLTINKESEQAKKAKQDAINKKERGEGEGEGEGEEENVDYEELYKKYLSVKCTLEPKEYDGRLIENFDVDIKWPFDIIQQYTSQANK